MNALNLNSLYAISPFMIVLITGALVLLGDACVPLWRRTRGLSAGVSIAGIALAAMYSVSLVNGDNRGLIFGGAITADHFSQACNLILLATAALAVLLAPTYLESRGIDHGEYYGLVLFSTSGSMLMAASVDLITLFVALEILSVALYVLAGFARTDQRSEEAALKYFLLGAFAGGFLLYGIALVYGGSSFNGIGGTTNLVQIGERLRTIQVVSPMMIAGVGLILVGLGFKAALVPFHMWTPDVYEGAPTSVTAYMASGVKIAAFATILRVFNALFPIAAYWLIAIQILAVITMFAGNIIAIWQENVKRLLAYSSIAHAGYILVAVSAASAGGVEAHNAAFGAAIFYLFGYAMTTMGAFGVLIWLSKRGHDVQTLADLKGLARRDAAPAYAMLIFMLSLGGVPPTMGFMGKWFIFNAAVTAGQTWLALALALASIISIYYYLKVVWMMCFQEPDGEAESLKSGASGGASLTVYVAVGASLLFGILPTLAQPLMTAAATLMRP